MWGEKGRKRKRERRAGYSPGTSFCARSRTGRASCSGRRGWGWAREGASRRGGSAVRCMEPRAPRTVGPETPIHTPLEGTRDMRCPGALEG
ncbi:hypothetical protein CDAR_390251 [Caerostris darwini]|uniref:Uncharacterized protein n=1 Tax=Caerostris darwini TaxID=1538125 RepID=A0AAV4P111_9ARAC|nr:hypothetical protein CDAR_390251 [Caerostris darwini]